MKITNLNSVSVFNVDTNKKIPLSNNISTEKYSISNNYQVPFFGSQTIPLTEEDYYRAKLNLPLVVKDAKKRYPNQALELKMLDVSKLNGLQKDIKVFEGLTMKEIAFVLKRPNLLLNRCCPNNCIHCAYMATPMSNRTLDRMSFEDFNLFLDGVVELDKRLGDNVSAAPLLNTFIDSDCMEIELFDKDGNLYDYIDCLELISQKGFLPPLFDTCGWNPNSKKMQERAEFFVDYITSEENQGKVSNINISLNPFHSIFSKSKELTKKLKLIKASQLRKIYVDRMANVLFTFTPILSTSIPINFLARTIPPHETNLSCNTNSLYSLQDDVLKKLKKLYKEDLNGKQRYVQNKSQITWFMKEYSSIINGNYFSYGLTDVIKPWGRAENLYNNPESTYQERASNAVSSLNKRLFKDMEQCINPNGSVVLLREDIAVPTNIKLNFENQGRAVKPLAHQVHHYEYKVEDNN